MERDPEDHDRSVVYLSMSLSMGYGSKDSPEYPDVDALMAVAAMRVCRKLRVTATYSRALHSAQTEALYELLV